MNGGIFSGSLFSGMGQVMQPVTALRPMELTPTLAPAPPIVSDQQSAAPSGAVLKLAIGAVAVVGLGALGYFVWRRRQVKANRSRRRR